MSAFPATINDTATGLRAGLAGLFEVTDTTTQQADGQESVRFRGRFLVPAEQAYERVRAHFARLGYTPFFTRETGDDIVVAGPGTIEVRASRRWINVVLFVATALATIYAGALNSAPRELQDTVVLFNYGLQHFLDGLPYAVPLMTILLCHEFGHYLTARRHRVAVSLPYFIPMPVGLGTMGAAIVQKEPFRNRKVLFDVGVAGPLAGLVVAIPVLLYGLSISQVEVLKPPYSLEGNSLLYLGLKYLVFGRILPGNGVDVNLSPVAAAGWVGLLVTSLNLLPAGQLDGGHIAYVLFGRHAQRISQIVMVALALLGGVPLVLGLFGLNVAGWGGWLLWAVLIYFFARWHPPALDEVTELDPRRRALAWAMVVVFVLVFIPVPLILVS